MWSPLLSLCLLRVGEESGAEGGGPGPGPHRGSAAEAGPGPGPARPVPAGRPGSVARCGDGTLAGASEALCKAARLVSDCGTWR